MLMNEKQFYTSPEVDVLVVRFEGDICGSKFGNPGAPGSNPSFNDYPDF